MVPCRGGKSQAGSILGPSPPQGARHPTATVGLQVCVGQEVELLRSDPLVSQAEHLRLVVITVSFLSASSSRLTSVSSQYQGQPGPTPDLPSPAPKGPPRELAGASLHLQGASLHLHPSTYISLRQRNGGPLGRGEVGRTPGPTTVYLCLHAPCSRQLTTQQSHTASPLGSHLWDRFPTLMRLPLVPDLPPRTTQTRSAPQPQAALPTHPRCHRY